MCNWNFFKEIENAVFAFLDWNVIWLALKVRADATIAYILILSPNAICKHLHFPTTHIHNVGKKSREMSHLENCEQTSPNQGKSFNFPHWAHSK